MYTDALQLCKYWHLSNHLRSLYWMIPKYYMKFCGHLLTKSCFTESMRGEIYVLEASTIPKLCAYHIHHFARRTFWTLSYAWKGTCIINESPFLVLENPSKNLMWFAVPANSCLVFSPQKLVNVSVIHCLFDCRFRLRRLGIAIVPVSVGLASRRCQQLQSLSLCWIDIVYPSIVSPFVFKDDKSHNWRVERQNIHRSSYTVVNWSHDWRNSSFYIFPKFFWIPLTSAFQVALALRFSIHRWFKSQAHFMM